jgi:hypothetical protein
VLLKISADDGRLCESHRTYLLLGVHGSEASAVGVLSTLLGCGLDIVLGTVGKVPRVVVARHDGRCL